MKLKGISMVFCFVSLLLRGRSDGGSGGSDPIDNPNVQTVRCTDDLALDLFAADTDSALRLSWNSHGGFDASGGYRVRYGTSAGACNGEQLVACTILDREATLTSLTNDTMYYIVGDSLNPLRGATATSCEIKATPHALTSGADLVISPSVTSQSTPAIASARDDKPLFALWIEDDIFVSSRPNHYSVSWSVPFAAWGLGLSESSPTLTSQRRVAQTNPDAGELEIVVEPALFAIFIADGTVKFIRGDFPDGPTGSVLFSTPVDIGAGGLPATAAYADRVEIAYEKEDGICTTPPMDGGLTFSAEQRVDNVTLLQFSTSPDVAIDPRNDDV